MLYEICVMIHSISFFSYQTIRIIMNVSTGTMKLTTKRSKNHTRGTEA